ncbi:7 transmembrane sweet-taste receptor of 3 GCPR [Nitzschia inconspicua]|uniref:7 transmembrane sweet-taste receptor of 3 GCPR n=1 Tax=Nitzschia inconspicua TaxID=303405 RepID=A0A9K3LCN8_9STRA|nr:7 transmembrane sweet-taste receptor of 3 GCPR [Nitzschia inconspicua]KAG7360005.1 7 transmembrane sweet-taste receptor of 3 GCPR [Nitzschia inconspicua]
MPHTSRPRRRLSLSVMSFFLPATILLVLCGTPATAQDASELPIVGTLDGYDVGGNYSICWTSQFDDTIQNTDAQEKSLLNMNRQLETNPQASLFTQLPTCSENGTKMTISRTDEAPEGLWVMWKGNRNDTSTVSAVFEIDLEVNLDDFTTVNVDEDSLWVWYRVFMCNAPRVGFCQPLVDSPKWDGYNDPIVIPDDLFAVVPTVNSQYITLDSVPTDDSAAITFRTDWVANRLQRFDSTLTFTGKIQLPTMCWDSMGGNNNYIVVGHATLELPSSSGNDFVRVDVSSLLPGDPLMVTTKPTVKDFSTGAIVFVSILIGVAGLMTLGMFCYIVVHRNHRVMTLAQSGMLGALAAASCATIIMSFLLMPLYDAFCKLQALLFLPATFMPTILVGRLWRVYTTLSVAHSLGRSPPTVSSALDEGSGSRKLSSIRQHTRESLSKVSKKSEEWVMKFLSLLACSFFVQRVEQRRSTPSKRRSIVSLRRTTTRTETLLLIFFLTLPQVVVTLFDVIHYWDTTNLWISYSEDAASGRIECRSRTWVTFFSGGYLAAMFVLAMYVAWCSRLLPSAFNEKDAVFRAGFISGLIVIIITVALSYSDIPEVSPNLYVCFKAVMAIGVSLLTAWSVIMPKIRRVHSGEMVVLTNILRDMNGVNTSSLSSEEEEYRRASQEAAARPSRDGIVTPSNDGPRKRVTHCKTVLRNDEPIPKKLERQLYQLNGLTEAITDRCAEGRPMDKTEWEALLRVTTDLTREFENVRMRFNDAPGSESNSESNRMNGSFGELERAGP